MLACVLATLASVKLMGTPAVKALKLVIWMVAYVEVLTLEAWYKVQVIVLPLAAAMPVSSLQGIALPEVSPVPRSTGQSTFSKLSCVGN